MAPEQRYLPCCVAQGSDRGLIRLLYFYLFMSPAIFCLKHTFPSPIHRSRRKTSSVCSITTRFRRIPIRVSRQSSTHPDIAREAPAIVVAINRGGRLSMLPTSPADAAERVSSSPATVKHLAQHDQPHHHQLLQTRQCLQRHPITISHFQSCDSPPPLAIK